MKMELFPKNFNAGHWRTLQAISAYAIRFAIGLRTWCLDRGAKQGGLGGLNPP